MKRKDFRNCSCSIFRAVWENTVPKRKKYVPMKPPQTKVVVHYNSHTDTCTWYDHCMEMMRQLYKKYQDLGFEDIPYNFVVGADGEAYCARGWKRQSDPSLPYPELVGSKIDILLFGDWSDTIPPKRMRKTLASFIDYGIEYGRITKDYDLLIVDNNLWDEYTAKHSNIVNNIK
ncbi:peptidoglycan-recognition protein 1-like [Macrosteles quadrilineatus]|uniref:peptidoglycan-recognition protein 1-like n=1 Tax=Macrosteles quadrilineatus TaxID=74068 RepID=UPI0023E1365D|nr:peptidoglycan-recognition protein 1-like [Macrosteles quadrilineatus]